MGKLPFLLILFMMEGVLLAQVKIDFSLNVSPGGLGNVSVNPGATNCDAVCPNAFAPNTQVTLNATPASASLFFRGWQATGSASNCNQQTGPCVFTITAPTDVTALFAPKNVALTLSKAGTGTGTVTSVPAGIQCGSDCSEPFAFQTSVTLTPVAASGSEFKGWINTNGSADACATKTGACTFKMVEGSAIAAKFDPLVKTVQINKVGGGTITASPVSISCAASATNCSGTFPTNSSITLTPAASGSLRFSGWSEGQGSAASCNGQTVPCTFSVTQDSSLKATFATVTTVGMTVEKVGLGKDFGLVTSTPPGINCGSDCSENFPVNTVVKLKGHESVQASFLAFETARGSASRNNCHLQRCEFLITEQSSAQVRFNNNKVVQLTVNLSGSGSVLVGIGFATPAVPAPITCNGTCTITMGIFGSSLCGVVQLQDCAQITLTPTASAGQRFGGWSLGTGPLRGCDGSLAVCSKQITGNESIKATFVPQ